MSCKRILQVGTVQGRRGQRAAPVQPRSVRVVPSQHAIKVMGLFPENGVQLWAVYAAQGWVLPKVVSK